ncbi:MAG TPA: DUF4097 family beta strand repeat-containing protein [Gemmatimonadaceae bacterium]
MRPLFGLSLLVITATSAVAQGGEFQWSKAEPASTVVTVHDINGDVSYLPGTGSTVEVTARRHGDSRDNGDVYTVVKEYPQHVVVCVLFKNTDESCDEDGAHMHSHRDRWGNDASMDVTVKLPSSMLADAHSVSGDIRIDGAQGDVRASTVSGDVKLRNLNATSVRATSVSGDVDVAIAALSGSGDLNFRSVSGNVTVTVPHSINADFSMSTVSGDLDTDFPLTLNGRMGRRNINAHIGKGGREFTVSTVSGDVRLRALK